MKNKLLLISLTLGIVLLSLTFKTDIQNKIVLISTLFLFMLLFIAYLYFEKNDKIGTKEIALVGTLSGFIALARIVFAPIPNGKPVTFMVALCGYVFGPYEGFLIGSTAAFISNIFFGQGPWTPWQMFSFGIIGVISGLIGRKKSDIKVIPFSVLCFIYGFLFDYIMDFWQVLAFVKPFTIKAMLITYAAGFYFDMIHGVSSFLFSMIFYKGFLKVLNRYKRRLMVTYLK